jgi:alkylation response protein AidB-like acyl-CoA dehydrogenase
MDFEPQYTPEQQAFRDEVRTWLGNHLPSDLAEPADSGDLSYEQYMKRRDLGRSLGEKGWLWPTAPQQYGGGGLTIDHAIVIEEEMDKNSLSLPPYYDSGGRLGGATILVWGSEEQKDHFLTPIFTGQVRTWQLLTEPDAGSDLAGVKTAAIKDGDDYVINGQKIYVGSNHGADQFWMVAVTDPDGKRHENLGWFMVPSDLPGITINPMDLLISGGEGGAGSGVKNTVFFDNVRVPSFHLIGGENEGWKVGQTHLELEHGTGGNIRRNSLVDRLFEHCKTTDRDGQTMIKDPDVRDLLADVYIEAEISRLFGLRNYWMRHSGQRISYEGPQSSLHRKMSGLRIGKAVLEVVGPAALTYDPEWGPANGHIEAYERSSIVAVHPGGTADIQRVIMARRIGIGRATREQAGALV